MKNLRAVEKNWRNPFEEGTEQNGQNVYREYLPPHPQAANQLSFLSAQTLPQSSVSDGPLPSFLTRAPLGAPYEETPELKPRAEMPVTRQKKDTIDAHPLSQKAFEQEKQIPNKNKKKARQPSEISQRYERGRENRFIHRWVYGEVRLSMSKMSIMGLVLGLLFLGALFFIIGFLAAVSTLEPKEKEIDPQHAWQTSDTHQGKSKGHGVGKWGRIASAVTGNLIGQTARQQLAPLVKGASAVVPRPLQPFARYGIGSANAEARNVGRQVNPFSYHRGRAPEQPYYVDPHQAPQQYAAPQLQPYGVSPMPGEYQGYPPVQPIYPMHPQPMAAPSMQPMAPQPQQMMMQPPLYPPYPPQMAPQQGWYR